MTQAVPQQDEFRWANWWRELVGEGGRAGRAELRRCGSVAEAAFCPQFHRLRWSAPVKASSNFQLNKLAMIAVALAHVNEDCSDRFDGMGSLFASLRNDKPLISDQRFRQLLRSEPAAFDERLADLVRVIRQVGRRAPIEQLAWDLWYWTEQTRRKWALDFYGVSQKRS